MVSLRRRKLLGFCTGISPCLDPVPKSPDENGNDNCSQNPSSVSIHPLPPENVRMPDEMKVESELPNGSGLDAGKLENDQPFPEQAIKRRKRHRRKNNNNQEPCVMRGVYFKNMKWQAAIKVDKKQIHLGTVSTQEEAARLYDRAAFMCNREPNFELPEDVKKELRKLTWEEFLAMTRHAITNKKHKRRAGTGTGAGTGSQKKCEPEAEPEMQNSDWDGEQGVDSVSGSDEAEPEAS